MAEPLNSSELEATHILVLTNIERSRGFYRDILGAEVHREYGGTSLVLRLAASWLLLVTGGGPTEDKPDVTFSVSTDPDTVSHAVTLRVPDCNAAYEQLRQHGVAFLTPPVDHGAETRCFFRDPDGHLVELSEYGSA